jgi:hypothetical protein
LFLILFVLSLYWSPLNAQSGPKGLLPSAVTIAGIIVDSVGQPLPNVRIDHSTVRDLDRSPISDREGRFRIETLAPAAVFRKDGYISRFVRTREAGDMHNVNTRKQVPTCSQSSDYVSLGPGTFTFRKVKGVRIGKASKDIDAVERSFIIGIRTGAREMVHGYGASWGGATPRTLDIWVTAVFEEAALEAQGLSTLDSRGETVDGRFWRSVGRLGESVSYFDADRHDAILFDSVLDGLCVQEAR